MFFILQKEPIGEYDLETYIVKQILDKNKFLHKYISLSIENISYIDSLKNAIPIGSIEFVEKYLKIFYNIDHINPIEIPLCLRKREFLKRKYLITNKENIPEKGRIFLKDVSKLKYFSEVIDCETFFMKDIWSENNNKLQFTLNPNHYFEVSEVVNILSEYRIYVQNDKIICIAHYNGDQYILPDIKIIDKMIKIYSLDKDKPKSYTMDIAVNENGTFVLEIHPFISVGLYNSLWSSNLLYAYRDGIDYVLNYNTKIKPDKIDV